MQLVSAEPATAVGNKGSNLAPGQLGAAARPDPDRQTGTLLNEDDADVEAPPCCVLEREPD
jgi:hypothetical protein